MENNSVFFPPSFFGFWETHFRYNNESSHFFLAIEDYRGEETFGTLEDNLGSAQFKGLLNEKELDIEIVYTTFLSYTTKFRDFKKLKFQGSKEKISYNGTIYTRKAIGKFLLLPMEGEREDIKKLFSKIYCELATKNSRKKPRSWRGW